MKPATYSDVLSYDILMHCDMTCYDVIVGDWFIVEHLKLTDITMVMRDTIKDVE